MIHRKKASPRKPKDYLVITLRNLLQGQEILCTSHTFENIKDRVNEFSQSRKDLEFKVFSWGGIKKIRRVA